MVEEGNLQQTKFIRNVDIQAGAAIAIGATLQVDLSAIEAQYGHNYNQLIILNIDTAAPITVILDGKEVQYMPSDNTKFGIKAEDNFYFSTIAIKNESGADTIARANIKITLGRA